VFDFQTLLIGMFGMAFGVGVPGVRLNKRKIMLAVGATFVLPPLLAAFEGGLSALLAMAAVSAVWTAALQAGFVVGVGLLAMFTGHPDASSNK
jgi:hypothetical protein